MEKRYSRALGALTEEEIERLQGSRAAVVGCGGIGGYVIEELARLGVGEIIAIDPDCFDETNLNRQLLSRENNIGKSKAQQAAERIKTVNSKVSLFPAAEALCAENAERLLSGCQIAIDALDSAQARRVLAKACGKLDIPLVHGAISGWRAQISVLMPRSDAFNYMYPESYDDKALIPSLSFTPALAASIEAAEAVKLLVGREASLSERLLLIDLLNMEFNTVLL